MAYNTLPTKANGQTLDATYLNQVRDNFENLNARLAAVEFSGGRWTKGATQSIADSTQVAVTFPTAEVYDEGGWGLTATNTKATVPAGAIPSGFTSIAVLVTAYVEFAADADGRRIIAIHKNGSEIAAAQWNPDNAVSTSMSVATEIEAEAGDEFTVEVLHIAGGALNVNKGAFTISRRGPF